MQEEVITPDERMWASLAHASILINLLAPSMGAVGAMAVWLFKRKSSTYVGYQALQAFIYQAVIVFIAVVLALVTGPGSLVVLLAAIIYAAYAVFRCHRGLDFRYVWIGDLIASLRPRQ